MARDPTTLGLPPPSTDLIDFPFADLNGKEVWRACRAEHAAEPWYFSSSGKARYDLEAPYGTCYWAEQWAGAVLETFLRNTKGGVVSSTFAAARRLVSTVSDRVHMADVNDRRARTYNLTTELGAVPPPYDVPQAWAAALHNAGFDGIRWALRHDPALSRGLAYFGLSGKGQSPRPVEIREFDRAWRNRIRSECGIEIRRPPGINDLTLHSAP